MYVSRLEPGGGGGGGGRVSPSRPAALGPPAAGPLVRQTVVVHSGHRAGPDGMDRSQTGPRPDGARAAKLARQNREELGRDAQLVKLGFVWDVASQVTTSRNKAQLNRTNNEFESEARQTVAK